MDWNGSDLRVLKKILFEVSSFSNSRRTRLDWILLCMHISFASIIKVLSNAEGEITSREVLSRIQSIIVNHVGNLAVEQQHFSLRSSRWCYKILDISAVQIICDAV